MKKIVYFVLLIGFVFILAACGPEEPESKTAVTAATTAQPTADIQPTQTSEGGMGMGMGGGMMARHHAAIPTEYAGLSNPIPADDASIARGGETYATHCATCHGDGGMGDGPGGVSLDPVPVNIAHTSQMMGDDYLFWRVSEGGAMEPFNSGMIAWGAILDEDARWDVLNYVQALGRGDVEPRQQAGGAPFDPAVEAEKQAKMLADGVAQGVITEEESAIFAAAHTIVDEQMIKNREAGMSGSMDDMMADVLAGLVESGDLSQADADTFSSVHDRLGEAGLMQ